MKALGLAIADLRRRDPRAEIATALFVPQAGICLPVRDVDKPEDMRQLASQVRATNPWVSVQDVDFFLEALGLSYPPRCPEIDAST